MTETIPEMLWSATPEGAIDYCNARVLDYTGFSADEIMGNDWTKLLHPDDVEQTVREWMSCVTTGAPYRVEVRTFHAADRTYRWCVTSALPLLDQQGRILKWHGTVVDMHDWKQAQEELRNTQAELAHMTRVMTMGELTASIAHEVNQPLSGIITNASTCLRMLAADPPNVEGARETAQRTIRDSHRASDVITRLRALFSKKDTAIESVDLNEATQEVIALSLSELQRNRVILRPELADDLPLVAGDRVQLQQVILNLVRNASDAMSGVDDRPRRLVIRTERDEGDHVRLSVQDVGAGFGPQRPDKLFEPFYTTKNGGMGIGLSVSRSIVESHHGRLWATPNDGPGATFSFSIPCHPRV
jgi:PAS domain S-box-containing protein